MESVKDADTEKLETDATSDVALGKVVATPVENPNIEFEEEDVEEPRKKTCFGSLKKCLLNCVKNYWKGLLAMMVLYSVGFIFSTFLQEEVQTAVEFFRDNGALGAFLYIVSYTFLLQVGVPTTLMEIGVAFLYDEFYQIFLMNIISKNIGKSVGFFLGKYVFYKWVEKNLLSDKQTLTKALSRLFKKEPYKYATLWALAYVPTWSQTYGLPVLGCSFLVFTITQNIAGITYSILWTFVGITTRETIEDVQNGEEVDVAQLVGTSMGIFFLILSVIVGGYYIRREWKQLEAEEAADAEALEAAAEVNGEADANKPTEEVSV